MKIIYFGKSLLMRTFKKELIFSSHCQKVTSLLFHRGTLEIKRVLCKQQKRIHLNENSSLLKPPQ